MSSTRHAENGSPFRQERYASSPEFDQGLKANLVAKRCGALPREDRDLLYFLLLLSHREGGIAKVASQICANYPHAFATSTMRRLGVKTGQVYSAEEVRKIRLDFPQGNHFSN